jgi:cysteine desulfuration protein SufE
MSSEECDSGPTMASNPDPLAVTPPPENESLLARRESELEHEFSRLTDWEGKYGHIIRIGEKTPTCPPDARVEANLVRGCQSQVWLTAEFRDGKVHYLTDSDSAITRGLAALAARLYSGAEPAEILRHTPDVLRRIGLDRHLSPTRSNGLLAMIRQMKMLALGFASL